MASSDFDASLSSSTQPAPLSVGDWLMSGIKAAMAGGVLVGVLVVSDVVRADRVSVQTTSDLGACLVQTQVDYETRWQQTCQGLGYASDCLLPQQTSDAYASQRREHREDCYRRFPSK